MAPVIRKPVLYPFTANNTTHQSSSSSTLSSPSSSYSPTSSAGLMDSDPPLRPTQQQHGGLPTPAQSSVNLLDPSHHNPSGPSSYSKRSVQAALARAPPNAPTFNSMSSNNDSRYDSSSMRNSNSLHSVSEKFNLSPDPSYFLTPNDREPDDYLHNPDPRRDRKHDRGGSILTARGLANLGCLVLLCVALVGLFAGYPMAVYFTKHPLTSLGAFNLGGTNASGQVPILHGHYSLIDPDTPRDAYTIKSTRDTTAEMNLVFSDEFNVENRTFWPGDDPFWEAVDLHYWQTNNLEWYYPGAITTKGGSLQITLSQKETHNLNYQGGMMSTWNKFCFTGGMILASVQIPGINNVLGLWPAIWTMGNLGRAGYGASLEGMWPYTYDSCDVGTMPNQTINGQPQLATVDGDPGAGGALSFLPGQKLSRCTCAGEDHPGPIHKEDGSFVGRAAPEIDIFEAQVDQNTLIGGVSQSAQWAPFNYHYEWFNDSSTLIIPNTTISRLNTYTGGAEQQATSVVTNTNVNGYQLSPQPGRTFETYGFEYLPGFDDAYITWISGNQVAWTLNVAGMGADSRVQIAARPVPQEPLYIIMNLGMSKNFGPVDFDHLIFPAIMSVDWVRVYQPQNSINIGCDPDNFPTADYINRHIEAYTNANLTTWVDDFKQPFPKNKLKDAC